MQIDFNPFVCLLLCLFVCVFVCLFGCLFSCVSVCLFGGLVIFVFRQLWATLWCLSGTLRELLVSFLHFGGSGAPFGHPWNPYGHPWAPFGHPRGPFWCLFKPLGRDPGPPVGTSNEKS